VTCIVGLQKGNNVYIGGDSAGVAGYSLLVRGDRKVFHNVYNSEFIFGFTSSFRMGQILRYRFDPPPNLYDWDVERYVTTDFVDGVRKCLKEYGFGHSNDGPDEGGSFLFGYSGRLFAIHDDYQIEWHTKPYNAVGCGGEIALGALDVLIDTNVEPLLILERALTVAEQFSSGVRGPFHYVTSTRQK